MSLSTDGTKYDLCQQKLTMEEDGRSKGRSLLEKCLIAVSVVLFILMLVFAILFGIHYNKSGDERVCLSKSCVVVASKMVVKMDPSVDPCQDFSQYACGGFNRDTIIPDDKEKMSSFTQVIDDKVQALRALLEAEIKADDPESVKKVKKYFSTCMDKDTIQKVGLQPYWSSGFDQEWPTINPQWDPKSFNLKHTLVKFSREFSFSLFAFAVNDDLANSSRVILHFQQPQDLALNQQSLKLARDHKLIMAYQQILEDVAIALGANPTIAQQDASDIVDFELEMVKILVPPSQMANMSAFVNPTTLEKMSKDFPYADFHQIIQAAFDNIGVKVEGDMEINVFTPPYFDKLRELLKLTDARVIQNFAGMKYAYPRVIDLTEEMRDIKRKYKEVVSGKVIKKPRWKFCYDESSTAFAKALSKMLVTATFSEDSKHFIDDMVGKLKDVFERLLTHAEWMGETTKKFALQKFHNLGTKIGYPEVDFSNADVDRYYQNVTVADGQFYMTNLNVVRELNKKNLQSLFEPKNNTGWALSPLDTNAYYATTRNEIVFPVGILRPPFFWPESQSSVNFGAIGAVIGHEITHGFDQQGSQFNHLGNIKNWWAPEDWKEFKARSQCIIDKYGAFKVEKLNMSVDGELTLVENTADLGGLKESYLAYKEYAAKQPEELPLPGLQLNTHQQFFLAFAQLWCAKSTVAAQRRMLLDPHSPERFRIIGTLQSTDYFAEAFNCPKGSYMNPVDKCVVW